MFIHGGKSPVSKSPLTTVQTDGVRVGVGVGVGVGVNVAVAVAVAVAVGVNVAVAVGVDVAVAVGLGLAVGVGVGVGVAPAMNSDWLGMPLVKTVTSAWPRGKPLELMPIRVIGVEVKEVSDQPAVASTGKKSVCSLARLSSWTSG